MDNSVLWAKYGLSGIKTECKDIYTTRAHRKTVWQSSFVYMSVIGLKVKKWFIEKSKIATLIRI